MATVNKHSLREEFDRLKAEFEQLSTTDKMSAETRALCNALLVLFEVLMAIFMEKTTSKGSRNSSLPPSQTSKDETAATRPGGKSKGQEQNDARSRHSRTVTTTAVAAVDACANCGADLGDTPSQPRQRRTRVDILFGEGRSSRRRGGQRLSPVSAAHDGTLPGGHARPAAIRQWPQGLHDESADRPDGPARPGAEVGQDADRCDHLPGNDIEVRAPLAYGAGTLGGIGHRRTAPHASLERR